MLTTNRAAAVALGVLAVVVLFESRKLPLGSLHNPGPAYMPVLLALALLVFAILVGAYGGAPPGLRAAGGVAWPHPPALPRPGRVPAVPPGRPRPSAPQGT